MPRSRLFAPAIPLIVITATACASAPPPATTAPNKPPTAPAPAAALPPPDLSLLRASAALPPAPPPPAEPLPPLARPFAPVALPARTPRVLSIAGRDERDVWLLAGDVRSSKDVWLLRWDGAAFTQVPGPSCSRVPFLRELTLTPTEVVLRGAYYTHSEGEYVGWLESRWPGKGKWSCTDSNVVLPADLQILELGSLEIRFESQLYASDLQRATLTIGGRRVALPDYRQLGWDSRPGPASHGAQVLGTEVLQTQLFARSAEEIWLHNRTSGVVFRSSGSAWEARPTGLDRVLALWVDDTGSAWVVGVSGTPAQILLRWDVEHGQWTRLSVPPDLNVFAIIGSSSRDVWLVGRQATYHWDGERLHRGDTPLPRPRAAWISSKGELWLGGGDDLPTNPDDLASYGTKPSNGTLFRTAPVGGKAP